MKYLVTIKNAVLWLPKKAWSGINTSLNFLVKHDKSFYTGCFTALVCMLWMLSYNIDHTKEMMEVQKKEAALTLELHELKNFSKEATEIMTLQSSVITQQKEQLQESDRKMRMQYDLIQKLVDRLRGLGGLPRERPPIDPDKII